jgi:hypothetical protein
VTPLSLNALHDRCEFGSSRVFHVVERRGNHLREMRMQPLRRRSGLPFAGPHIVTIWTHSNQFSLINFPSKIYALKQRDQKEVVINSLLPPNPPAHPIAAKRSGLFRSFRGAWNSGDHKRNWDHTTRSVKSKFESFLLMKYKLRPKAQLCNLVPHRLDGSSHGSLVTRAAGASLIARLGRVNAFSQSEITWSWDSQGY